MYFVLLLAGLVVLGGVVLVAMGRGGELTTFVRDLPELRLRLRTPSDVAMLRLPLALLGCQEYATASALRTVAWMLQERDAEIAMLREELRALQATGTQRDAADQPGPAEAAEPQP